MRRLLLALLLLPAIASASDVTIPNEFVTGTPAVATEVNANFDAVEAAIDDNYSRISKTVHALATTPGTTTAGIQEAIDSCGNGIGATPTNGCRVVAPCGEHSVEEITMGGSTLNGAKEGLFLTGCGAGTDNSAEGSVGGTHLEFVGTAGNAMITITNCRNCGVRDIGLDGQGSAGIGIDLYEDGSGAPSSFFNTNHVTIDEIDGYGVRTATSGQIDYLHMAQTTIKRSVGCYQQRGSQHVATAWDGVECSRSTSTTDPVIDIEAGEFNMYRSFGNTTETGQTLISIGSLSNAKIRDNRFELIAQNSVGITSTGGIATTRDTNAVTGNYFSVQNTGITCLDYDRRGYLELANNTIAAVNNGVTSGVDAGCPFDLAVTSGTTSEFLIAEISGNSQHNLVASVYPEIFEPTTTASVIVSDNVLVSSIRPTQCRAGQVLLDSDETWGSNAYICNGSDTWAAMSVGLAATATALAANGSNCSAGNFPLGVDASGAVESCTDATTEIDAAVDAKSAATSVDNTVPRFNGTTGDVQGSGVLVDDANNLVVLGSIAGGVTGGTCMIWTDLDDGTSQTAVWTIDGVLQDEVDTNGVCNDGI